MLTEVYLAVAVSGTSVSRDFVELPSQLYEHWLTVPAVLEKHALHHKTGEPMPKELLDKMLAARNFDAGFATVEFTSSALVDMAFHASADAPAEPAGLRGRDAEAARHARRDRHAPSHAAFQPHLLRRRLFGRLLFLHVVGGARRRRLLGLRGDRRPFDPETRGAAQEHIYAAGGSADPEELYIAFRGKMPTA